MSKKTLNKTNLAALGAEQLADLLIEVSTGNADIKRRLRLELSYRLGTADLAHEVRKRLASLRRATGFVGWRRRKALIRDLETQVAMIVDKIASGDPATAVDLLWQFIDMAPHIHARVDDSKGDVRDVFRTALGHLADIAPRTTPDPENLAERVWSALLDNANGDWDGITALLAPTLGQPGLSHLKSLVQAHATAPPDSPDEDHEAIRFLRRLRGGDSYAADRKARFIRQVLRDIAAAEGDTGGYIAHYSDTDLKRPGVAAEVAALLLADGKAPVALDILRSADQSGRPEARSAWDVAYIASLIALDRTDAAQAHRWSLFEAELNARHLHDYLRMLPDFEDVEAEDRARTHVLTYADFGAALAFCLDWPDLLTAAALVEARADEIDGNLYALLTPAAEALRTRHPRAAVLLLRAMIGDTLGHGRTGRYGHAADHLADCAALVGQIADYGPFPTHARFTEAIQTRHLHKSSFWDKTRR